MRTVATAVEKQQSSIHDSFNPCSSTLVGHPHMLFLIELNSEFEICLGVLTISFPQIMHFMLLHYPDVSLLLSAVQWQMISTETREY